MSQTPDWSPPEEPHGAARATSADDGPRRDVGAPPSPPPPGSGWGSAAPPPGYRPAPAYGPQYGQQHGQGPQYGQGPVPDQPVKPGAIPLRPLSLGEIYDGAFQVIRTYPLVMLGMSAAVVTVVTVLSVLLNQMWSSELTAVLAGVDEPGLQEMAGALGTMLVAGLASGVTEVLAVGILSGLLVVAVSRAVIGQSVSLGQLWPRVRGRVLPLVGLNLLLLLAYGLAYLVCLTPGLLALLADPVLGTVLLVVGALLGLGLVAYVAVRWSMSTPALLLEGRGVLSALRRSWALVGSSFWRVLGILALTFVITFTVAGIISVPFALLSTVLAPPVADASLAAAFELSLQEQVVQALGSLIVGVLVYPFTAVVTGLLYIDLRMRREGLDVELAKAAAAARTA